MGEPEYRAASLFTNIPGPMQNVRLIHYPQGEPARISEVGQIVQIEKEYISHNIKTSYGSSGAPIFDLNWNVVAIHRGTLLLSRPLEVGLTEGVPLYSFWKDLGSHLAVLNK